jgi:hypothetical protein
VRALEKRFKRVSVYETQLLARGAEKVKLFNVEDANWKCTGKLEKRSRAQLLFEWLDRLEPSGSRGTVYTVSRDLALKVLAELKALLGVKGLSWFSEGVKRGARCVT